MELMDELLKEPIVQKFGYILTGLALGIGSVWGIPKAKEINQVSIEDGEVIDEWTGHKGLYENEYRAYRIKSGNRESIAIVEGWQYDPFDVGDIVDAKLSRKVLTLKYSEFEEDQGHGTLTRTIIEEAYLLNEYQIK